MDENILIALLVCLTLLPSISPESRSGVCCVVFAHLEPPNTRSPFSVEGTALAQITKYIVREGRVWSRPLFLRRPRPPFTVTVIDELVNRRDMPSIKQQ